MKDENGNILITVMMALLLTLILGTGFLTKAIKSHEKVTRTIEEKQGYMVAKSVLDGIVHTIVESDIIVANKFVDAVTTDNYIGKVNFKDSRGIDWRCEANLSKRIADNKIIIKVEASSVSSSSILPTTQKISGQLNDIPISGDGSGHTNKIYYWGPVITGPPNYDIILSNPPTMISLADFKILLDAPNLPGECGFYKCIGKTETNWEWAEISTVSGSTITLEKDINYLDFCLNGGVGHSLACANPKTLRAVSDGDYIVDIYSMNTSIHLAEDSGVDANLDLNMWGTGSLDLGGFNLGAYRYKYEFEKYLP